MKELDEILKRIELLESKVANQKILLPFKDALPYLGFSASYLYRLCYTNKIPHHKPTGRTLFFYKDELDQWILKGQKKRNDTHRKKIKLSRI